MNYEFIATIATILLVGASVVGVILAAVNTFLKTVDARFGAVNEQFRQIEERFKAIDERFERIEARLDKHEERFLRIEGQLLEMQKQFTVVNAGIARLEGLMEGILSGGLVQVPLAQARGQQAEATAAE